MPETFDPAQLSTEINEATTRVLDTARSMTDDDVLAPSLLPRWSRGHVLTHLARHADGTRNLLQGAIEGVGRTMYPSREARDADIEAGARRPIKEQVADLETAHDRLAAAIASVPPARWEFVQDWGFGGRGRPTHAALEARLREVAIHHLDLGFGFAADQWTPEFALRILRSSLPVFEARGLAPCVLKPSDVDAIVPANGGSDVEISGPAHALTTWLLGRDSGSSLRVRGGALPTRPTW
jgi:maleylpyruvate isomerase